MVPKKARLAVSGMGALCAAALSWSSVADASYITCTLSRESGQGLISVPELYRSAYSLQCNGLGLNVFARAEALAGGAGIRVSMRGAQASLPNAYAFGYDANQVAIPGCVAHDPWPGTSWETTYCSRSVKFLTMVLNAS